MVSGKVGTKGKQAEEREICARNWWMTEVVGVIVGGDYEEVDGSYL